MKHHWVQNATLIYNKLRALMNMYEGKLIMYACIIRETFVFTVFRRVFHSILKLELCWHACRRRDQIIPTCRYGKNMPTTALHGTWNIMFVPFQKILRYLYNSGVTITIMIKLDCCYNANISPYSIKQPITVTCFCELSIFEDVYKCKISLEDVNCIFLITFGEFCE